jgi:hypothetical protein
MQQKRNCLFWLKISWMHFVPSMVSTKKLYNWMHKKYQQIGKYFI